MPEKKITIMKYISWIYCVILPALLFIAAESLNTSDGFFSLAVSKPGVIVLASLAIFIIAAVANSILHNLYLSYLSASIVLLVFYIVNFYRSALTGWVLVPGDLSLIGKLGSIVAFANIEVSSRVVLCVFVILLLPLPLLFLRKQLSLTHKAGMIMLSGAIALMFVFFINDNSSDFLLPKLGIHLEKGLSANKTYADNGALVGFYMQSIMSKAYKPEGYSEAYMKNILTELESSKAASESIASEDKPNVIIIMSEAFTDPARWTNIEFSQDPAPNLHALQAGEAFASGNIITPAFGGSTCNPEWEFLTGNIMKFNTGYDIPFQQFEKYINSDDLRSLPNQFKMNGYKTLAIHPFTKDFFNRDKVYPRLGFDEFLGNTDMIGAPWKGYFITDDFVSELMLNKVAETKNPLFLFNVSMENHYNYEPTKFESLSVKISDKSGKLSEHDIGVLETYLEGIHDADAALGKLIDGLSKSDEKTIVYFFGDHCPLLGDKALDIFNKLGTVSVTDMANAPLDEFYYIFTTPYVIWSNYELEESEFGDMSPYFAGAKVMELAGLEQNIYFNFLNESYETFHGYKENLYVNEDDTIHSQILDEDNQLLDKLFAIQYDTLYGKRYIKDRLAELK